MAGINFRTASKFAAVTGNSASTGGSPNNATLLFTCPSSHEAEIVFLQVSNDQTSNSNIGIQVYPDNTKQYKTFEEDTVQLALDVGFKHTDTWWLSLSTQQGGLATTTLDGESVDKKQENRYLGKFERPNLSGRKFEPTFIFTK